MNYTRTLLRIFVGRQSLLVRTSPQNLLPHYDSRLPSFYKTFSIFTSFNAACKSEDSAEKKGKKMGATPVGKLDVPEDADDYVHPDAEKEPLKPWPDGINPQTGERGGPKGPEPTRYGDWERKGRVSDF